MQLLKLFFAWSHLTLVSFKECLLKQKSRTAVGSSFGSLAISFKDPPLSVPSLQKVWLCRVSHFDLFCIKSCRICQIIGSDGSGMKKSSITGWTLALRDRSPKTTLQEGVLKKKKMPWVWKGRGRWSKLSLFKRKQRGKGDVVYYLPVAERILCLISGFSRNTNSARFNIKKKAWASSHSIPDTACLTFFCYWRFHLLIFSAGGPTRLTITNRKQL